VYGRKSLILRTACSKFMNGFKKPSIFRLVPWLGTGLYLLDGSARRIDQARSLYLSWYRAHGPIVRAKHFGQNRVYVVEPEDLRKNCRNYSPVKHINFPTWSKWNIFHFNAVRYLVLIRHQTKTNIHYTIFSCMSEHTGNKYILVILCVVVGRCLLVSYKSKFKIYTI
jgi:hypothetical protein